MSHLKGAKNNRNANTCYMGASEKERKEIYVKIYLYIHILFIKYITQTQYFLMFLEENATVSEIKLK